MSASSTSPAGPAGRSRSCWPRGTRWYPPERVRLPELPVGPVDDAVAAELLRHRAPDLAPPVAAAIAQAAAGNPLALVELPATLTADQRAGARTTLELPARRRVAGCSARSRAGSKRCDEQARRALLIAAAYAGTELPVIAAACLARRNRRSGSLADAEASGLVRLGAGRGELRPSADPRHGVRGGAGGRTAASRTPPWPRRCGDDDDRRAWHLAAAAIGPDEEVAADLERVGGQAVARRAYAAGSGALERAARLSAGPRRREPPPDRGRPGGSRRGRGRSCARAVRARQPR